MASNSLCASSGAISNKAVTSPNRIGANAASCRTVSHSCSPSPCCSTSGFSSCQFWGISGSGLYATCGGTRSCQRSLPSDSGISSRLTGTVSGTRFCSASRCAFSWKLVEYFSYRILSFSIRALKSTTFLFQTITPSPGFPVPSARNSRSDNGWISARLWASTPP